MRSKEENIDINFNLSFVYKEYKDWQKVIDYSKTALYLIEETKQNEKAAENNVEPEVKPNHV